FSFCVTFWEGLYGERPFGGSDLGELRAAVTAGRLRPPPEGRDVPEALHEAIRRGLGAAPSARPASMEALLAAIEAALPRLRSQGRSRGTAAAIAAPGRQSRRMAAAGMRGLGALSAIMAIAIVVGIFMTRRLDWTGSTPPSSALTEETCRASDDCR